MPEGPSLLILKEELQAFKGKKIISVSGNSKLEIHRLEKAHTKKTCIECNGPMIKEYLGKTDRRTFGHGICFNNIFKT